MDDLQQTCHEQAVPSDANASWYRLVDNQNTAVKRLRIRELSGEEVEEHQLMMHDESTSLPMVVDCSDTSLVGILHYFHCEHCCLLCFLALVLDYDNNSGKDI